MRHAKSRMRVREMILPEPPTAVEHDGCEIGEYEGLYVV